MKVIVTGASSGIGRGIATVLAGGGCAVGALARSGDKLESFREEISASGGTCHTSIVDLRSEEETAAGIAALTEALGGVDALINNAGHAVKKPTVDLTEEEMLGVFDVHVRGAFALSKHAATRMMVSGGGSILFLASMASLIGIPYIAAYAAAKSAHLGMVRTMAVEWSPKGVRVNAIAPGWIMTDMTKETVLKDAERTEKILSRTPLNEFGEPEDIGWAAAFLASPAARFITGVCLPVDGGVSIGF